jgi:hypothetical protein
MRKIFSSVSFLLLCLAAFSAGRVVALVAMMPPVCNGTDACMELGGYGWEDGVLIGLDCGSDHASCSGVTKTCETETYSGGFGSSDEWCACPGSTSQWSDISGCCIAKLHRYFNQKTQNCGGNNCNTGQQCTLGGEPIIGSQSCNCSS